MVSMENKVGLSIVMTLLLICVWIPWGAYAQQRDDAVKPAPDNLVTNASFEEDMAGWRISFPGEGKTVAIDGVHASDGHHSVQLTKAVAGSSIGVSQDIKVEVGQLYRVEAWVRVENLQKDPSSGLGSAMLRVQFRGAQGAIGRHAEVHLREDTDGEWVRLSDEFAIPEGTNSIFLDLFLFRATGNVWWDGVSLMAIDEESAATKDLEASGLVKLSREPVGTPRVGSVSASPIKIPASEHPRLFICAEEIAALRDAEDPSTNIILQSLIIQPAGALVGRYSTPIEIPGKGTDVSQDQPHYRLIDDAVNAGLAYAFSGNVGLAKVVRKILLAYAQVYGDYPLHHATTDGRLMHQTLDEAEWLRRAAWAYDLTLNSGLYSTADRQKIEDDLLWEAVAVIDRNRSVRTGDTWQARQNAGIGAVAFLLDHEAWINEVLFGPQGFMTLFPRGLRDDGLSWMQSMHHHYSNLSLWLYLAEAAYRGGYDLYRATWGEKSMKDMFDAPIYHTFSNGKHPIVGHATPGTVLRFDWTYALAYQRYRDPVYAWLWRRAPQSTGGGPPMLFYLSALRQSPELERVTIGFERFGSQGENIAGHTWFRDSGMVTLRGRAEKAMGPEVVLLYKPHGTVGHQASDNLSLMMSTGDHNWLPGLGDYEYPKGHPEQGSWYEQSVARTGVVVDERSQYPQGLSEALFLTDGKQPSSGELLHFVGLPSIALAEARTDNVYEGVRMNRRVLVHSSYVIDHYTVSSEKEHRYDWVMHVDGKEMAAPDPEERQVGSLGSRAGYQHIVNVRSRQTDDTWKHMWEHPRRSGTQLQAMMLGGDDTEVIRATGWGPKLSDRPLVMARRTGKSTQFVTLIEPFVQEPVAAGMARLEDEKQGVSGLIIERTGHGDRPDQLVWHHSGTLGAKAMATLATGQRFEGELAFFGQGDEEGEETMLLLDGVLIAAEELSVEVDAAADLAIEREARHRLVVTQRSGGTRQITIRLAETKDVGAFQLYKLGVGDRLADIPVEASVAEGLAQGHGDGGQTVLEWAADPGVVYVLGPASPERAWLERFAVTICL
jgi:hypothetical protein